MATAITASIDNADTADANGVGDDKFQLGNI